MKTIKLKQHAMANAIGSTVADGKCTWTTGDHSKVLSQILADLIDDEGSRVTFTREHLEIIEMLIAPTPEGQKTVLLRTFRDAGYELDAAAKSALTMMVGVAQFGDQLTKTMNPVNGRPFVKKVPKLTKRKAFESLLGGKEEKTQPLAA